MKILDVLGKPCPIPVIETKKALADPNTDKILVKVDAIVAVQNLQKMAAGYGYDCSYEEDTNSTYQVLISKRVTNQLLTPVKNSEGKEPETVQNKPVPAGLTVVISRNTMGEGTPELGKILIKGFIYSLTELPNPPKYVIFLNSGAYLTSANSNTIDDLKKLAAKGTEILTCGTCVNFYGLQETLAVGAITDMYGITEKMATADKLINL